MEQGAATTIWALVSESAEKKSGQFCVDCNFVEVLDYAKDMNDAKRLWEITEKQTNSVFPDKEIIRARDF